VARRDFTAAPLDPTPERKCIGGGAVLQAIWQRFQPGGVLRL